MTGLMRSMGKVQYPVGVVPLGRTNSTGCALLGLKQEGVVTPADIAEATMAVVRGDTKDMDSIRVEVSEVNNGKY